MLRNYKGFTLLEVMISLFLIISTISILAPIMKKLHVEEKSIHDNQMSLHILSDQLNQWILGNDHLRSDVFIGKTDYHLQWNNDMYNAYLCITWTGYNGRSYKQCGQAKRD